MSAVTPATLSMPADCVSGAARDAAHGIDAGDRSRMRLRWRCRRGMLENDLILTRFLDARGDSLEEREVAGLHRLLGLADGELWDLLCGRAEPQDATLREIVALLRSV